MKIASGPAGSETRKRNYVLALLTIVLAFNFVDRFALGIVLEDIKKDLHLTDTQLGFMSGIAFALFYSTMGIPLARWADHGNRAKIISLTTALWGVMVALCGAAGNFVQLLLIRMMVAVGEAGCIPTANSLLADYFNRAERPRAAAILAVGPSIGIAVGYLGAGWLSAAFGWRLMFAILGFPGLILAFVFLTTVSDPRTFATDSNNANSNSHPFQKSISEGQNSFMAIAELLKIRTFVHILLGLSVTSFFAYGILLWQPTFFARSHHLSRSALGMWFATILGIGGILGSVCGGEWASRKAASNERRQLTTAAFAYVIVGTLAPVAYLASNYILAFGVLFAVNFLTAVINGPFISTIQTLVPARIRAVAFAFVFMVANLIGMGLGPLAVGALSDFLRPFKGEDSLRYALLTFTPGYIWAAWHYWMAGRTVMQDLESRPHDYDSNLDVSIAVS
jgi:MFS family permease